MNKQEICYTEAPKHIAQAILHGEAVADFLPAPEAITRKESKTKITITLASGSVKFFKKYAEKKHSTYQAVIHNVLDTYAQKNKNKVSL